MRYTDLRDFIAQLERLGQLKRIKAEVFTITKIIEPAEYDKVIPFGYLYDLIGDF